MSNSATTTLPPDFALLARIADTMPWTHHLLRHFARRLASEVPGMEVKLHHPYYIVCQNIPDDVARLLESPGWDHFPEEGDECNWGISSKVTTHISMLTKCLSTLVALPDNGVLLSTAADLLNIDVDPTRCMGKSVLEGPPPQDKAAWTLRNVYQTDTKTILRLLREAYREAGGQLDARRMTADALRKHIQARMQVACQRNTEIREITGGVIYQAIEAMRSILRCSDTINVPCPGVPTAERIHGPAWLYVAVFLSVKCVPAGQAIPTDPSLAYLYRLVDQTAPYEAFEDFGFGYFTGNGWRDILDPKVSGGDKLDTSGHSFPELHEERPGSGQTLKPGSHRN
jgi:hypothetical protein